MKLNRQKLMFIASISMIVSIIGRFFFDTKVDDHDFNVFLFRFAIVLYAIYSFTEDQNETTDN